MPHINKKVAEVKNLKAANGEYGPAGFITPRAGRGDGAGPRRRKVLCHRYTPCVFVYCHPVKRSATRFWVTRRFTKPINQPADRFPISFRTSLIYVVFLGLPGGTKLGKSGFLEEGNDDWLEGISYVLTNRTNCAATDWQTRWFTTGDN